MKVSVAICTFNGEKYIREQLESIINQSCRVDEIVLCDDRSEDNTAAIVSHLAELHSEIQWRIINNPTKLGVVNNFAQAIRSCTGEIVLLSDQDDIWNPKKVEVIRRWFVNNPTKSVVFTNATFLCQSSIQKPHDLFSAVSFGAWPRLLFNLGFGFELFSKQNRATGATMALRRSFYDDILLTDGVRFYHDQLICLAAVQTGSLGFINRHLIQYRIHSGQTCGLLEIKQRKKSSNNVLSPLCCAEIEPIVSDNKAITRYLFMRKRAEALKTKDSLPSFHEYCSEYRFWGLAFFLRDKLSQVDG